MAVGVSLLALRSLILYRPGGRHPQELHHPPPARLREGDFAKCALTGAGSRWAFSVAGPIERTKITLAISWSPLGLSLHHGHRWTRWRRWRVLAVSGSRRSAAVALLGWAPGPGLGLPLPALSAISVRASCSVGGPPTNRSIPDHEDAASWLPRLTSCSAAIASSPLAMGIRSPAW